MPTITEEQNMAKDEFATVTRSEMLKEDSWPNKFWMNLQTHSGDISLPSTDSSYSRS